MKLSQSIKVLVGELFMFKRVITYISIIFICLLMVGPVNLSGRRLLDSDPLAKEGESLARSLIEPYVIKCGDSIFIQEIGPDPDFYFSRRMRRIIELKGKTCSYNYLVSGLKESEKLNGIEHKANLFFKCDGPSRTWYPTKGWGQWNESKYSAQISVIKQNGGWTVKDVNTSVLGAEPPRRIKLTCEQIPK